MRSKGSTFTSGHLALIFLYLALQHLPLFYIFQALLDLGFRSLHCICLLFFFLAPKSFWLNFFSFILALEIRSFSWFALQNSSLISSSLLFARYRLLFTFLLSSFLLFWAITVSLSPLNFAVYSSEYNFFYFFPVGGVLILVHQLLMS